MQKGNLVRCINSSGVKNLKEGRVYTIIHVSSYVPALKPMHGSGSIPFTPKTASLWRSKTLVRVQDPATLKYTNYLPDRFEIVSRRTKIS